MKLKLNREYAQRHLFVAVLMIGLGCWFAYDGIIGYQKMSAHDLYVKIECAEPPEDIEPATLEAFKLQKIKTQYGFATLALALGLLVGARLFIASRFAFEFDDDGFTFNGKRYAYSAIKRINESKWESKRIVGLVLDTGELVVLDAWHHVGVKEFHDKIKDGHESKVS